MTRTPASETADRTLADLVLHDARAARVFENFGLDFCCNGRRTLREATDAKHVHLEPIVSALAELGPPAAEDVLPAEWDDLSVFTRHIVDRHHGYVRSASPALRSWLDRLVQKHGERHAELGAIRQTFGELADELSMHMLKEENILFPYINDLAAAQSRGTRAPASPFGTVLNPVRVMEADHALAGELMAQLRALSAGFAVPPDGCATYRLCFAELEAFERDLHRHIHLENNVLFPRAIELERSLA